MTLTERGVYVPENETQILVSSKDIIQTFGFDYKPVVIENLKKWIDLFKDCDLRFFEKAEPHKGSKGLYFLEQTVDKHWVFLQAMFGDGISTKHKHGENVPELYLPLAGESFLTVDGKEHRLEAGIPFEVFPGQVHQLTTREDPSLNLIVMKNSAHIPRNELHIPVI